MANPFLVIGGVAVGVVTAGIGVMQVPGWIDSAHDSAVREDLSQVAIAQEAAYTVASNYIGDTDDGTTALEQLTEGYAFDNAGERVDTGVEIQVSSGVELSVAANEEDDRWAALGESKSGHVFVRTSESADVYQFVDARGEPREFGPGTWRASFKTDTGRVLPDATIVVSGLGDVSFRFIDE